MLHNSRIQERSVSVVSKVRGRDREYSAAVTGHNVPYDERLRDLQITGDNELLGGGPYTRGSRWYRSGAGSTINVWDRRAMQVYDSS
jgi:hypothetical protein